MSVDTMLGNRKRGREIDWKRVADSYREDMCKLIEAGNRLAREVRALTDDEANNRARDLWAKCVLEVTAAEGPICVHKQGGDEPHQWRK